MQPPDYAMDNQRDRQYLRRIAPQLCGTRLLAFSALEDESDPTTRDTAPRARSRSANRRSSGSSAQHDYGSDQREIDHQTKTCIKWRQRLYRTSKNESGPPARPSPGTLGGSVRRTSNQV
jgi:hypothetical protein